MHAYRVGHRYNPKRGQWPETGQLRITESGVELVLFFSRPTSKEIREFRQGRAEFAWIDGEHASLLAYRFGDGIPWSDAAYHPGRDPQAGLPSGHEDPHHMLILAILVNADDGVIAAIRQLTWPPVFARRAARSVRGMLDRGYNAHAHEQALRALFERWPSTEQMVRQRADVTCVGGTDIAAAGGGPDAAPD